MTEEKDMRRTSLAIAGLACLFVFCGCPSGDDGSGDGDCSVGAERCPCTAGGACDGELACLSNICVVLPGAGDGDGRMPPDGGEKNPDEVDAGQDNDSMDAGLVDPGGNVDGGGEPASALVPLYNSDTELNPPLQIETADALITRFSDRARDRHAREDQFQAYDHYLAHYWEHRTAAIEIVDTIGKGGDTITFNVASQWRLQVNQAELRFFYRGLGTVAEYHNNGSMTPIDATHYTRSISYNNKTNAPLQVGDRLEFELSQFLDGPPVGRINYYGTAFLYIVGQGIVPWKAVGVFGDFATELEDSYPIPEKGWLGGGTTLSYAYSDEPDNHFMQMATNLADIHGQTFVRGRRIHHTDMSDGSHNESLDNPVYAPLVGTLGPRYVNNSCVSCHTRNGRGLPPAVGAPLEQYVVHIGTTTGEADPLRGHVFQTGASQGGSEGQIVLASWADNDGLRIPGYTFSGAPAPQAFSVRIAPQLVGMGLLEAISESDILQRADPNDADGDGISGRAHLVTDPETGVLRLGRLGWKASASSVRHQVASALRTDMGVMTSVYPTPDCGPEQNCQSGGPELTDEQLHDLTRYNALLGVRARRDLDDPTALQGETLFDSVGCTSCHVPRHVTSPYHPLSELRDQIIWPYTDLLVHDMGPGLADNLSEDDISGAEWRTPPLWGIGLTNGVSGGEAYLHDGRARTLHEAIRWHGGEGDNSRAAYEALSAAEQDALLRFLGSL